ncbi:MAG: hypothetical protein K9H49_13835 [Bacteroidales bacterium]|nr:hypothetical protein [Bacteroidales bacterium]MCF8390251.1 hypothetical protein [Bacteroidales bacterium]
MFGITEKIRSFAFWNIDKLKGGKINRHFGEVKSFLINPDILSTQEIRSKHLEDLLLHAQSSTQFYKDFEGQGFENFPIIDKITIRENPEIFQSENQNFIPYKTVVTSGSTGTPFSLKHDKRKSYRNTADTIFFNELAGLNLGQRLYYFKIWNLVNKKNKILQYMQNIVPCDVSKLDDQTIPDIIKKLNRVGRGITPSPSHTTTHALARGGFS